MECKLHDIEYKLNKIELNYIKLLTSLRVINW